MKWVFGDIFQAGWSWGETEEEQRNMAPEQTRPEGTAPGLPSTDRNLACPTSPSEPSAPPGRNNKTFAGHGEKGEKTSFPPVTEHHSRILQTPKERPGLLYSPTPAL